MPVHLAAPTVDDLRAIAERIGAQCTGGDVLVLTGDLGAGKTTFTQGLARGLGITDVITSPTFVISRVHRGAGSTLIHVDAYRLGSLAELEDLDLEADLAESVVAVEWGRGLVEGLSPEGLDIVITRSDLDGDEVRQVSIEPRGMRWASVLAREWAAGAWAAGETAEETTT